MAAAQFLPNLNAGLNYDAHTGPVQQANGSHSMNRNALYLGGGSNAVAAGTVNVPGIAMTLTSRRRFSAILVSRQEVTRRRFAEAARTNEMLRRVASAYLDYCKRRGFAA